MDLYGCTYGNRKIIDELNHPALMVDTISSLASIDYRHDEWGVDVTVAGSQKDYCYRQVSPLMPCLKKLLKSLKRAWLAPIGIGANKFKLTKMVHFHTLLPQICYMV